MSDVSLRLGALPLDIAAGDPARNLETVEAVLSGCSSRPDIVVLPELFSTGFISDPEVIATLAEDDGGRTMCRLRDLSSRYECGIAGSYLARHGERSANRAFIVLPDGREVLYDKRHLFCLSPESRIADAGVEEPPVIEYRGLRVSIVVCYDLRFPAWCRNRGERYDILLVPANWPDVREYAWRHLLIARAIENQAFVAGVNRSGCDRYGCYDNTTYIFDETGHPVGRKEGELIVAEISKDAIDHSRQKLPVGRDADDFAFT